MNFQIKKPIAAIIKNLQIDKNAAQLRTSSENQNKTITF